MAITLRPGREEDMPVIEAVALQERLDSRNLQAEQFVIAEAEGRMIGFGRLVQHEDCWEVACLYVAPDYRRKGVGSGIVRELLDRVTDQRPVYAVTATPQFFSAVGFRKTKELSDSVQDKRAYCEREFRETIVTMKHTGAAGG